jgi:hypothetical protein
MFVLAIIGGAEEDRTPDPLLAKQVLSQLSYSPSFVRGYGYAPINGGPERIRTSDPSLIRAVL